MAVELLPLTDMQKTALHTLYGKALDARTSDPILGDTLADAAVRQLDFDFRTLKLPSRASISLPVRAKHLDGWTREFLAAHPSCVVLHLGCGLDTRVYRIDPPATVQWYDVDLTELISLRERLYPSREGYELVGASVTDPEWLERIPSTLPVLIVAEGLVMHVPTAEVGALFERIMRRFPAGGQFIFDNYSAATARTISFSSRLTKTRIHLHSGLPTLLAEADPGPRLLDSVPFLALPELGARMAPSGFGRAVWRGMLKLNFQRDSIRHLRYEFG